MASLRPAITPAMLRGLKWFLEHGSVALFDQGAPSYSCRNKLEAAGLIEKDGREAGGGIFACTRYRISAAGRAALSKEN